MRAPALGWQLALAFVLSFLFLAGLIGWLENVHIITGNGMYKAIQAEPWIADFGNARLDPSNYLYFPLYALLAKLLDALGILKGVTWKQFAYLNALWAALSIVFVYAFVLHLTGRVAVAVLVALFHLGCGTFLLLGVINEDIMPAYALLLASMLLAGLWFDRPTYARVALVGAVFTLGWLIEWRLMFPTLPAFVLALAFAAGTAGRRAAMIAALIVSSLAVSGIVELLWEGHNGAVGLHDILWTGKGVFKEGEHDVTGWAGLSLDKAWMMLAGVGNYFLLIGGFVDPLSARHAAAGLSISVLLQVVLFAVTVMLLWPRRHEPRVHCLALVFLGTLGAGEVLNFYAQPQDPQMQVNVMVWLTVAWASLLAALSARGAMLALLAVLSIAPLAWNVGALARYRGGDTVSLAALDRLDQHFQTDRTVFLYWGFEPILVWQFSQWSHSWDMYFDKTVPEAPSANPKFKWLAITTGAVRNAKWTPQEHAAQLKRDIDRVLDHGYRIAVDEVWGWSVEELAGHLAGLVAAGRAPAIWAILHDNYEATPVYTDPMLGPFWELRRRAH
jgi:hypothetical protein